jgi:PadR family transcriptional regulator PadR
MYCAALVMYVLQRGTNRPPWFAERDKDMSDSLGRFEELILLALLRLGPEAYGLAVRREIEDRTGRDVSTGALYTGLKRLERRGLVSSEVGEPTAERGGRRKRHYDLETAGLLALRNSYVDYTRMAEGLGPRIHEAVARSEKAAEG